MRMGPAVLTLVKKHGSKEPQSFSHWGSFDHPNLQSLNKCNYLFIYLCLLTKILRIWGLLIYRNSIPHVIPKKQFCNHVVTTDQGGQKNCNWKTVVVLFYHVFHQCKTWPMRKLAWLIPSQQDRLESWSLRARRHSLCIVIKAWKT